MIVFTISSDQRALNNKIANSNVGVNEEGVFGFVLLFGCANRWQVIAYSRDKSFRDRDWTEKAGGFAARV